MKKVWSKSWKASTQKRKQRKYLYKAPLNIKHKMLGAPLSKELRAIYKTRTVTVRTGDTVKVKVGQFKGKVGKITKVTLKNLKVYVEGAIIKRNDGTEGMYPIVPSNLEILKLDLSDRLRQEKLEVIKKNGTQ